MLNSMKLLSFFIALVASANILYAKSFSEVAPGVYAAKSNIGGNDVYFGMEKIDKLNEFKWRRYADMADYLTKTSRGILAVWPTFISRGKNIPYDQGIGEATDFNELEFNNYIEKIKNVLKDNERALSVIKGVPIGVAGFSTAGKDKYVAYASKKPILGRFPFPSELPLWISLKKYYEYFGDLLMIVGSDIKPGSLSYENRGIFRNPISVIEDGNKYPGLSMKLHEFTALSAHTINSNTKYLVVDPAPSMRAIIVNFKGWQRGDLIINGKDLLDYSPEEISIFKNPNEPMAPEPTFKLRVEKLIDSFKN